MAIKWNRARIVLLKTSPGCADVCVNMCMYDARYSIKYASSYLWLWVRLRFKYVWAAGNAIWLRLETHNALNIVSFWLEKISNQNECWFCVSRSHFCIHAFTSTPHQLFLRRLRSVKLISSKIVSVSVFFFGPSIHIAITIRYSFDGWACQYTNFIFVSHNHNQDLLSSQGRVICRLSQCYHKRFSIASRWLIHFTETRALTLMRLSGGRVLSLQFKCKINMIITAEYKV